jgi:pyruvate carboxylase
VAHKKVSSETEIGAPLQGTLVKVTANDGDEIQKGQPLFVIEAMKMESTINAPYSGKIEKVYLQQNSRVEQDDCVLEIKPL